MWTNLLPMLLNAAKWLRTNPKVLLTLIVVGAFAYGWHEHGKLASAQAVIAAQAAQATDLRRAFAAAQDTTTFYRGRYQRQVVVLDSLPKVLAKRFADYLAKLAKGEHLVAGISVTTLAQAVTGAERLATQSGSARADTGFRPDTARSAIDTLGVRASVAIVGPQAWWNVYRAPTTLSVVFVRRPDSGLVAEATSSDGARLQMDVPFLIQPAVPAIARDGWWGWKALGALVGGFALGEALHK